jgi:formamidopyrimidine-DNA glycosylase
MPELPEVETVVRDLRRAVVGAVIVGAEILWDRSIAVPSRDGFVRLVSGQRIEGVGRRGKWIVIALHSGRKLAVHLRMTGRLIVGEANCDQDPYLRVRLPLDDGRSICFHDMRKFGRLSLVDETREASGMLGPEPLDSNLTETAFRSLLAGRRGRIKPLLLNQRFLAGLGNIYVDESLWRAGIHPMRTADSLGADEADRLWGAIRTVLRRAIASGGTTLDDGGFVGAAGQPGGFAPRLAVYGKAGEECPRCGGLIERIVVGQRGTHICPSCQAGPQHTQEPDDDGSR